MRRTHVLVAGLIACLGSGAADARFIQVDPVGYDDQVHLYAYVGNDPVNRADPSGQETHYYRTDGSILVVQTYQVDTTNGPVPSNATIESYITSRWSGQSSSGHSVTTIAVNSPKHNPIIFHGNSALNSLSPDPAKRSQTDRINGRSVQLAPNGDGATVAHEFGHGVGVEDQSTTVYDASGKPIGTVPNPGHAFTIMGDKLGPANAAQIDRMLESADKIVDCSKHSPPDCGGPK
jgi:hypothetical protein